MRMLVKRNYLDTVWVGLLVTGILSSCSKKEAPLPAIPASTSSMAPITAKKEEAKERPVYVYAGDKFRDPFNPAGQAATFQTDTVFDPQRATLKAVVYGSSMRSAVLSVGGSGAFYVKKGQIFDVMGKTVKGFSAKVFADRVIVLGEADTSYEIKLRPNEEAKK